MIDPASQVMAEIMPPSLANEMEEISLEHCHNLMTDSTRVCLCHVREWKTSDFPPPY